MTDAPSPLLPSPSPDDRGALTRRGFGALAAGAALLGPLGAVRAQGVGAGTVKLRILETTDIHVHVHSYDYYRDQPDLTLGLAKVATLLDAQRADARNTLLFENGDFLQGNPMGDLVAIERGLKAGDVHPLMAAMNLLGYDAGTLGNHEFDYGLDFLDKTLAGAKHPVACANVVKRLGANPRADEAYVRPYLVLERTVTDEAGQSHPLKVGVIGFVPPQIMQWNERHLRGKVDTRDIVEAAAAWVPEMRERGCDLVVALAHTGISHAAPQDKAENAALYLSRVPGIDVILTGHSHLVFPSATYKDREGLDLERGTMNGVPTVMAGFWGSHLGRVDLTLQRDGNRFRVTESRAEALPIFRRESGRVVSLAEPKPTLIAATQEAHDATLAYVRRPVGRTAVPLHTYFALVADNAATQAISDAQLWYARGLLKGTPHENLPLLSSVAPFKAGGRSGPDFFTDVPAGEVALKNVADLYIYPNTLKAVKVTGAQLADWLERSAGQFNQIRATADEQPLVNASFPAFNFDMIDGVRYRIDLTQPSKFANDGKVANADARRIVDLTYEGRPVRPDESFVVVTNNYRASGGGNFPGNDGTTLVLDAPDASRDVIIKHFLEVGTLNPKADGNWGFRPVPGATNVTFESSPKAIPRVGEVPSVSHVGEGANGFAKFRIGLGA